MYSFSTIGALLGLAVSIVLIIKKVQPAYSLILGALIAATSLATMIMPAFVLAPLVGVLMPEPPAAR